MEGLDLLFSLMDNIRSNLNEHPLDWGLDSSASGILAVRRTITVPGLGYLNCVTFNCKIIPEAGKYNCHVQAIAVPSAADVTETVNNLDAALQRVPQMMTTLAGTLFAVASRTTKS